MLAPRSCAQRSSVFRGAERFVCELVARVRRLGASGTLTVRADSDFWSYATIAALERHDVRYSSGVTQQAHVSVERSSRSRAELAAAGGLPAGWDRVDR